MCDLTKNLFPLKTRTNRHPKLAFASPDDRPLVSFARGYCIRFLCHNERLLFAHPFPTLASSPSSSLLMAVHARNRQIRTRTFPMMLALLLFTQDASSRVRVCTTYASSSPPLPLYEFPSSAHCLMHAHPPMFIQLQLRQRARRLTSNCIA